jgi:hypothetical protein
MSELIEIESVNLPRELREFHTLERFSAHEPGGEVGELMSFNDAVRLASGMPDGSVWFVPEEYKPAPAPKRGGRKAHTKVSIVGLTSS